MCDEPGAAIRFSVVRGAFLWITILCSLPFGTVAADQKTNEKLERLWRQVLNDPTDVQSNIKYALQAEDDGYYQRAISAYVRALNNDPANAIASRNLAKLGRLTGPAETSGTLIVSGSYNANSSQTRHNAKGDTALSKTLLVSDSRTFLNTRWNSSIVNFADVHSSLRNSDVIFTSFKSGPTWFLTSESSFNVSAIFDHTFIDKKTDSFAFGITGHYIKGAQKIKSITTTLKYTKGVNQGDLNYTNLSLSSVIAIADNFLFENDHLVLEPSFAIDMNKTGFDSAGQRDRLVDSTLGLTYSIGLTERQSMDVFQVLQSTYYFKHRMSDSRNRIDLVHNIGFSFNYKLFDNVSASIGFGREQKLSNFNEFHYVNYTTNTSLIVSF